MAKKQFKAESKRLLDLMINSIYTNKEIFLRELISNASDAVDKLAYRALTDDKVGIKREDFAIHITPDKENRTLTVSDNGIGMKKEELEENLGVIAKSGSFAFKNEVKGEENKQDNIDIIGQFGVGFYSAFMVSDKVTVISKAYGEDTAYKWESSGADGYTVTECEKENFGTDVIMHIKEDNQDEDYTKYLEEYQLRMLIKKYSDYIHYPIKMEVTKNRKVENSDGEDKEPVYESYKEEETLNSMVPLWHRNKKDITQEEYDNFYKEKFYDYENPICHIHLSTEGVVSYEALIYIPSKMPYDYFTKEYKKGLQLYSSGVMIMDKCEDLVPEHFRFIKGVVDSQDLSLNISREMLQQDRQLKAISSSLEKKIKRELSKMLENEREKYEQFFKNFGLQLKYGTVNQYGQNKELLKDLLLFYSSTQQKMVTLEEYASRMKEEQKYVYYACGETVTKIDSLPQVESIRDKGYEILYLTDDVDEFVMQILHDVNGKEIKSVNNDDAVEDKTNDEKIKKETEENRSLLDFLKESLKDKVKDVVISKKLKSHPVCLSSEGNITLEMEKYFSQLQKNSEVKAERVLEINASHPMFETLTNAYNNDKDRAGKIAEVLYNQALLIAGFPIENPTEYADLVCELLK
ncbi:MAG: molecular chaperone HtpG [Clostridiales bacterium]|nr:molecular chaperone HtpG [Clostridiales bacterium]